MKDGRDSYDELVLLLAELNVKVDQVISAVHVLTLFLIATVIAFAPSTAVMLIYTPPALVWAYLLLKYYSKNGGRQ